MIPNDDLKVVRGIGYGLVISIVIWTAVILLCCGVRSVHAEPLKIPQVVFTAGITADTVSTCRAFASGAHESNALLPNHCAALAGTKGAVGVMVLVATSKLAQHKPRFAKTLLYVGGAMSFGIAIHNARVAR